VITLRLPPVGQPAQLFLAVAFELLEELVAVLELEQRDDKAVVVKHSEHRRAALRIANRRAAFVENDLAGIGCAGHAHDAVLARLQMFEEELRTAVFDVAVLVVEVLVSDRVSAIVR